MAVVTLTLIILITLSSVLGWLNFRYDVFCCFSSGAVIQGREYWKVFTYAGTHKDFLHLMCNLAFLSLFGGLTESLLGPWLTIAFYLVALPWCVALRLLMNRNSFAPVRGVSGVNSCLIAFVLYADPGLWLLAIPYLVVCIVDAHRATFGSPIDHFAHVSGAVLGGMVYLLCYSLNLISL